MCNAAVDNSLNSMPVWHKRDTVFAAVTGTSENFV